MSEEQKQALIEHIETDLELLRNVTLKHCHEVERECVLRDIEVNEIALTALTAQPVKQPQIHDVHGFPKPAHIINSRWIEAIRAAGYEVQE